MISFNFETDFDFDNKAIISNWLSRVIILEGFKEGDINYIFCDDRYLHKLNFEFLDHDTLTDIISFDYTIGKILHGDIFISVQRVKENAKEFDVSFDSELNRVMIHGILHFCGYNDKSENEAKSMRGKENHYLEQLILNS